MLSKDQSVTYEGGCHCGAVRFRVVVNNHKVDDCNCSICSKKGFLHLIVDQNQFTLLQGEDVLKTYKFNTGVAQNKFCGVCGIHSFYIPRSHPDCIDVNVRCLDGNVLRNFEILPFDGANWEENIHKLKAGDSNFM
ncbi:MAG: GFA family protein [Aphanizomenon flos-aquae KM1D3_PB]|uniref:GFA family protein n=1 Tax=Aphanizomenon flos-aquae TaxID=1176 RepID=UPI00054450CF|nr:GFA family protein [Aphanizomenon flos-aquae]KHG39987.1 aldehyde-activating protein [Aphanizomenon flos-aquae 2012/KM1/D3]QSV71398.1 MAG: GFA family protein [Aphanizomenon flos-aquae KM1D3_PB]